MPGRKTKLYESRKQRRKIEASDQIASLMSLAFKEVKHDPFLAERYASIVWNLSTRFNVKMGNRRLHYCHRCKRFIVPPDTARIRLSNKRKSLNITCLRCKSTYRKLFSHTNVVT